MAFGYMALYGTWYTAFVPRVYTTESFNLYQSTSWTMVQVNIPCDIGLEIYASVTLCDLASFKGYENVMDIYFLD